MKKAEIQQKFRFKMYRALTWITVDADVALFPNLSKKIENLM